MKQTLLDLTQGILNAMDSDNVNSISDTVESDQVARIIRDVYYDLVTTREYAFTRELFQLEAANATTPTTMKIPDNVSTVETVKYNTIASGGSNRTTVEITRLDPVDFLDMVDKRLSGASNVTEVVDASGVLLNIITDKAPSYWTTFDDEYIVMDSYDSSVDSYLQSSKTSCYGIKDPGAVALTDGLIFDLPANIFPLLQKEAQATCFAQLKQMPDHKSEQWARKLRIRLQSKHQKLKDERNTDLITDYGRK